MFDLQGIDRLTEWKNFREYVETCDNPYQTVVDFWIRAPFVNSFLDPKKPDSWPDPWHLVLDDRLDSLAICLGMLYTLKLTRRFMDSYYEIHMSITERNEREFFLVVDDYTLNFEYGTAKLSAGITDIVKTEMLFSGKQLP